MADNDDFESFRGSIADLDADREQRIRQQFEASRAEKVRASSSAPPEDDDASVLQLVAEADTTPLPARHTRPVLIGVAAAVVLLALVGALTVFRNSGSTTTDVASGIDDVPLSEVAARAGALPDIDLQEGQVLYLKWLSGTGFTEADGHASGSTVTRYEAWTRRDGSGLYRISSDFVPTGPGEPLGTPEAEREHPQAAGNLLLLSITYDAIRTLPSTPEDLVNQIQGTPSLTTGVEPTVAVLSQLLALETTPPAVRAAGFEALAQLGAQPTGRVTMTEGAEGVGYEGADAYGRPWIVVVDPATTAVLGFAIAAGVGENTFFNAVNWNEYLDQQIEDGLPN